MARLSRVYRTKPKQENSEKRSTLSRSRTNFKDSREFNKDSTLLGNLFITVIDNEIVDATNDNSLIISRVVPTTDIKDISKEDSIYFNGIDTNISVEDDGSFSFGVEDFTIDWWEYKLIPPETYSLKQISKTQTSICKNSNSSKYPILIKNALGQCIYLSSNGEKYDIAFEKYIGDIEYKIWTHWALVRCNDNFYTYRNGIIKNIWASSEPTDSTDGMLTIGADAHGNNFYGCMSNIRVVKGQALWTEEFKPNSEELYY
jgi:hypothetical protein